VEAGVREQQPEPGRHTVWDTGPDAGPEPGSSVGVIVPYDFALDRELWRWVPDTSSLHVTRTPFVASPVTADQARAISDPEPVRRATRDVLVPEPGVVAFSCTSGSFVDGVAGERALVEVMSEAGAPRALTTAGALVAAFAALGVHRIALVSPYVDDLTGRLEDFLAAHGVETVSRVGLGLLGQIWRVSYSEVVRAVREVDHPDAGAVFISCTNLATYDVIARLEADLGKPVLTANQVTMWAALGAVGQSAVGPGQSLVACATPDVDRPVLRVVPEPSPSRDARRTGSGDGTDAMPELYKVRVRLPDESGALARLAAAVAGAGGNILSLSVHGQDSRSVVDEMLVGGTLGAERLEQVVRSAVRGPDSDAVLVVAADPHELVDAPTRALDLLVQARGLDGAGSDDGLVQGLAALLHADEVVAVPGPPSGDDERVLALPAPSGNWLLARRGWAPFTVTERARAEAFLRAVEAPPRQVGYEIALTTGEELSARPATGEEVTELDSLLRTCLAGLPDTDDTGSDLDWTAADLRAVLVPPGGGCLVVRTSDGAMIGLGSALPADELDPAAGPEPVLLVHPLFRGHRLGRWMRRKLAEHLSV
jgi:maleate cis-trans isomerase